MSITIKNLTLLGTHDFSKIVDDVLRSLNVTGNVDSADFDAPEIFNGGMERKATIERKEF